MSDNSMHTDPTDISFEDCPSRLIVLLYDAAIEGLDDAIAAIADGDIEGRFMATARTAEIVDRLHSALDMELGGEIAANLDQIYVAVISQLPVLNLKNDPEIARKLIALLAPLRASWAELDARLQFGLEAGRVDAENVPNGDASMVAGSR